MTYETITVETDARGTKGVTLLTINRPQANVTRHGPHDVEKR